MKILRIILLVCVLMGFAKISSGQTVVVSATNMKILFRDIENPLLVAVENHECNEIVLHASKGELLKRDDCYYVFRTKESVREVVISVGLTDGDSVRWIKNLSFRVRTPESEKWYLPEDDFDLSDTAGLNHEPSLARQLREGEELLVVIQPMLVQAFYRLVDNPFAIVIEGYGADQIVAFARYGDISYSDERSSFLYYTDNCVETTEVITIELIENNGIRWLRSVPIRLLSIPQPELYVSGLQGGNINKARLLASSNIWLAGTTTVHPYPPFKVEVYAAKYLRNDSLLYTNENITGNRFPAELMTLIKESVTGDKIIFNVVNASGFGDKCWQEFSPIELTIF